ncbi:apoptosis-inducing factor 3-like [Diabrotica virgifera virgifera]|uniref:Rieske domain-containing protein n=1 Tax=Diabrotica virgifera virgifera TaxID=50390 RepID=A0ABM5IIM9_DIAVI|nr:apoptosis-inducing factor 3-like [Diabrotica virgifera virgifera]
MIKIFSSNSIISNFIINKGLVSITTARLHNASQVKMSTSGEFVEGVVCKVSDIQENELKTFPLKIGEVLLVKQNNVISALGSKCTHYGAPLVNGALGNGRIRCPWHGACFKLSTGDIEEFPGLDSLPCYQVTIEDENVKVRAKKSDLISNKRIKPMGGKLATTEESIVIIGGGPAAEACAETLRQEKFGGSITMICKENFVPYDRARLSKEMGLDINTAVFRNEDFYRKYNIDILKDIDATKVDTNKKIVCLRNNTKVPYTKLFIATGNRPRRPCTSGCHLKNVIVLRTYEEAKETNAILSKDQEVVIIGSSFIAMEVAEYCRDKVKKISVVMRDDVPFKPVLGPMIGEAVMKLFKKNGVHFIPKMTIDAINGTEKVEGVKLHDGTILPADLVILGTGSNPNTDFLRSSNLQLKENGTIETNEYLESSVSDVFAGGDIALAPVWCRYNIKASIGHFGLAEYHGRIAALNMIGKKTELKTVPYFWTKLGPLSIRYCGFGVYDDIIYTGDVANLKFVAFYLENDEVIAVSSCGMDPYVSKFAELTAQGRKLKREDLGFDIFGWAK